MAIKPITDRQLIDKTTVDRERQKHQRDLNIRDGNESKTIIPG